MAIQEAVFAGPKVASEPDIMLHLRNILVTKTLLWWSPSFDLRQDVTTNQYDQDDVVLTCGGITLAIDFGDNPGADWTSYLVDLSVGGGWKIGTANGRVATEVEIRAVFYR